MITINNWSETFENADTRKRQGSAGSSPPPATTQKATASS